METWAEVTAEPSAGAATISTTPDVPGDVACSTTPIWAPVKLDSMTPISQEPDSRPWRRRGRVIGWPTSGYDGSRHSASCAMQDWRRSLSALYF
jgi:hypothetical protein